MIRARLAATVAAITALLPLGATPQEEPLNLAAPRALVPVLTRIADDYARERGQKVHVVARSSYEAIAAVRDGSADIALTDTAAEGDQYLSTAAAYVPFAVIVHPGVGVTTLTRDRARAVLSGGVRSWRELGGADVAIVRVERPALSAAQRVVERTLDLDAKRAPSALVDDTSSSVIEDVRDHPGAIGVVVLPYSGALDGVEILALDGRQPDAAAMREGYPLFGAEHVVTRASPPFNLQRLVGYIKSDSTAWREAKFVPIGDAARR